MTKQDAQEFRLYLKQCSDLQVQSVYEKEAQAERWDYAALAEAEAESRGFAVDIEAPERNF